MINKKTALLTIFLLLTISLKTTWAQPTNQNAQQNPSVSFAEVKLKDGSTFSGIFNQDPQSGTIYLASVNDQGQKVTYYINPFSVENVNPTEADQNVVEKYQTPVQSQQQQQLGAEVKLLDGKVKSGLLIPTQNQSIITILPEGENQPQSFQWSNLAWISQYELSQEKIQQYKEQWQKFVESQKQQVQTQTQPQSQTPAQTQTQPQSQPQPQPQAQQQPSALKLTLTNGDVLEGVVVHNPQLQMITIYSKKNNSIQIDYILSPFVKHVEQIELSEEEITSLQQTQMQQPLKAQAHLLNGKVVEGIYAPQQMVGSYTIINESTGQPAVIPANQVPRLTLTQGNNPAQHQHQNGSSTIQGGEKSSKSDVRETIYTHIPIKPAPDQKPEIPSKGTKVKILTNLNQIFEGIVEKIDQEWIILAATKIASLELPQPQRSLINTNNIVTIETI